MCLCVSLEYKRNGFFYRSSATKWRLRMLIKCLANQSTPICVCKKS